MRKSMLSILTALAALLTGAAHAGTATVKFIQPERFADAGKSPADEASNMRVLARHFEVLAEHRLPPGYALSVDVLDVDLAGTVLPTRRDGRPLRTVRGMADWPRMHLRYTLAADGATVASGDEWVEDPGYTATPLIATAYADPLRYEKRMLARWVSDRFGALSAR
jgi:hypothetical protein